MAFLGLIRPLSPTGPGEDFALVGGVLQHPVEYADVEPPVASKFRERNRATLDAMLKRLQRKSEVGQRPHAWKATWAAESSEVPRVARRPRALPAASLPPSCSPSDSRTRRDRTCPFRSPVRTPLLILLIMLLIICLFKIVQTRLPINYLQQLAPTSVAGRTFAEPDIQSPDQNHRSTSGPTSPRAWGVGRIVTAHWT